jgi:hypothetical protein
MTTLLPREQVDMLRSIGDAASVFLALVLIDRLHPGRSTRAEELASLFGKDRRSIETRLKSLCASDRACFDGRGYVLLEGGRALLLAPLNLLPEETDEDDLTKDLAPSPDTEQAPQVQAPSPEIVDAIQDARARRALLEEDININLSPSESLNTSRSAQNAHPSALQLLDATELLFGKTMTTAGLENKPRRLVIGWIAQAWDQRRFLRSPQGLIYARLSSGQQPQGKYYDHPRDFLPENYLQSVGLAALRPETESETESQPEEEPKETQPESTDKWELAWESVLSQLQLEMHRAPFESWVAGSKPLRFHGGTLYVGVRNEATREWLESRIRSTVQRLLVGICAESVRVEFITQEIYDAEE